MGAQFEELFLRHDLIPLGDNEARSVKLTGKGHPEEYPEALCIRTDLDYKRLLADFELCRGTLSERFIADRQHFFPANLDYQQVLKNLERHGFSRGNYMSLPMRAVGSVDVLPEIPEYTQSVLSSFLGRTFRQQYVIAEPGWETSVHRDHDSFHIHGIRLHIPLSASFHIAFPQTDGSEKVYKLKPGEAWYINPGRLHRAYNDSGIQRVNIQVQLDNDEEVVRALQT